MCTTYCGHCTCSWAYSTLFRVKNAQNARKTAKTPKNLQFLVILGYFRLIFYAKMTKKHEKRAFFCIFTKKMRIFLHFTLPILRYFGQKVAKTRVKVMFFQKTCNFLQFCKNYNFYSCNRPSAFAWPLRGPHAVCDPLGLRPACAPCVCIKIQSHPPK